VAYSPHLNGEKLTQREGAIAQYNLAARHAARIRKTVPPLFERLSFLPGFDQLVEDLTPKEFSARLLELVTNNLKGFFEEEQYLLEKTSDIWELRNTGAGIKDFSYLVAEPCSADYNHVHLKRLYEAQKRPDVLKYHRNINGLVIPMGDRWRSTTPQEVLNSIATEDPLPPSRYLKTPEQLQAIYEAAKAGEPLIQQVQHLTKNRQKAEKALNALLNPEK
jgi:hypothetical protein